MNLTRAQAIMDKQETSEKLCDSNLMACHYKIFPFGRKAQTEVINQRKKHIFHKISFNLK